jgi:hypothetical protein
VASKSLVKMAEDIVGELERKCVVCCVLLFLVVLPPPPCGGGVRFPFIGQGESELHACPLFSYMGKCGVSCVE